MNPRKIWPVVVPVVVLLLMTGGATTGQEKEDDPHGRVKVKLDVLTLHDGLPEGGTLGGLMSVGDGLGKQTSMRKDSSGKVVYRRTIEGQSRWLPDNAIEIMLEITENDVKRSERILLEGFEPKTLVLREDPTHGRRELLRLIPMFSLELDKSMGLPVEGPGKMGSNSREPSDPEPGKFQLGSPVLIRDNQVLINMTDSMTTATEKDAVSKREDTGDEPGHGIRADSREDPTHGRRELPKSPGDSTKSDSTKNDPAASLYSPGLGRFIFSPVPFEGATEGKLRLNQISFTLEGKSYLLLTDAPISSSQTVWVVHQPFWHPSAWELSAFGDQPMISVSSLRVLLDSTR